MRSTSGSIVFLVIHLVAGLTLSFHLFSLASSLSGPPTGSTSSRFLFAGMDGSASTSISQTRFSVLLLVRARRGRSLLCSCTMDALQPACHVSHRLGGIRLAGPFDFVSPVCAHDVPELPCDTDVDASR
ncbi:hypothetical protein BC938DRAFT_481289 [Jimgerdemannia flammicorona]|uniref:Uncharacterized protein n=1 Tax=Jimgerdemannia flammicorona TaxID=994334 RepID=A0A433QGI2_9FUNG|nr:hypothetical protein BC938DRAFT_481289 [Jimgerdemannia flammicorona]